MYGLNKGQTIENNEKGKTGAITLNKIPSKKKKWYIDKTILRQVKHKK